MKSSVLHRFFHRPYFQHLLIPFFAVAGFIVGFFVPLRISIPLRYDYFLPLVCMFLLLWTAWRLPQPWGESISICITTMLFSASFAALWRTSIHEVYEVFGLIPWFDSEGYYSEALRLLDGGVFSQIAARRPIFPGFFSFLLLLSGRNLRASLIFLSFIASVSTWLLAREFKLSEKNAMIPAGITTFLFFFYRKFNGAVLTETLGFSLGVLGLALLWNSATNRRLFPALAGLLCMTLALSARPGAVFSLPLLLLWIVFCLKTGTRNLFKIILSSSIIGVGLVINYVLTTVLAPGSSSSYSNFAQSFYGLVNGGLGWKAVYSDHPEFFTSGNEGLTSQQIYQAAWQIFKNKPEMALQGGMRSLQAFFSSGYYSAFNFLGSGNTPHQPDIQNAPLVFISRWTANILFILLLPITLIVRKNPKYSLLLAINLGIIISLPFAPPWDAENMRAYAVSIAGMASAVFLVLMFFFRKGKESPPVSTLKPAPAYMLASILIFALLAGPLMIRLTAKTPTLPSAQRPTGEGPLITLVSAGSTISIGENPSDPFAIPYSRFITNLDQFPDSTIGQRLKNIPDNSIISQQNDALQGGLAVWLVAPIRIMPKTDQVTVFCGNWSTDPQTKFIFFAKRVLP